MSAVEQFQGQSLIQQAEMLAKSGMVPKAFRGKPADVLVATLWGSELGLGPISSMQFIDVIEGSPTLNTEGRLALVRRAGHSVSLDVNDERAVAKGKRRDTGDEHTVTFSIQDAQAAGLANKQVWKQYRKAMLGNRAMSQLCRTLFSDVTMGMSYAPEEVASFSAPELLDSQPEALVRGRSVGSTGDGERVQPSPTPDRPPALNAPVEVVTQQSNTAAPRTFPAPAKKQTAAEKADELLAPPAPPAEPDDLTGVQPALMTALRATLAGITVQAIRDEIKAKFEAAGLPNIKHPQCVLSEKEYEVALPILQDAEEKQAELEAPFDAPEQGSLYDGSDAS